MFAKPSRQSHWGLVRGCMEFIPSHRSFFTSAISHSLHQNHMPPLTVLKRVR